jgi:hypothetical protein
VGGKEEYLLKVSIPPPWSGSWWVWSAPHIIGLLMDSLCLAFADHGVAPLQPTISRMAFWCVSPKLHGKGNIEGRHVWVGEERDEQERSGRGRKNVTTRTGEEEADRAREIDMVYICVSMGI